MDILLTVEQSLMIHVRLDKRIKGSFWNSKCFLFLNLIPFQNAKM